MKVKVFGGGSALKEMLKNFPSLELAESPEAIIVCGGDGSLLRAERKHPGVLKVLSRFR